jgi:hypothetical protein
LGWPWMLRLVLVNTTNRLNIGGIDTMSPQAPAPGGGEPWFFAPLAVGARAHGRCQSGMCVCA